VGDCARDVSHCAGGLLGNHGVGGRARGVSPGAVAPPFTFLVDGHARGVSPSGAVLRHNQVAMPNEIAATVHHQ